MAVSELMMCACASVGRCHRSEGNPDFGSLACDFENASLDTNSWKSFVYLCIKVSNATVVLYESDLML